MSEVSGEWRVASGEQKKPRYYRDLLVWQKSFDFADKVYDVTSSFPKEEVYGLTSQIRRSAVSIVSNIAEGSARNSTREFLHFISITKGSLAEIETQLMLAEKRRYLNKEALDILLKASDEISRMLTGLKRKLQESL
jgi:four helix bundle protein